MEFITEVRRLHLVGKKSIPSIARDLKLSHPTVRKHVKSVAQPLYRRRNESAPKLGKHLQVLEFWLASIAHASSTLIKDSNLTGTSITAYSREARPCKIRCATSRSPGACSKLMPQ